jgi:hypothetical protein
MFGEGQWYVIQSGPDEGTIHMRGWSLTAHLGTPTSTHDTGWIGFGTCPRCFALVLNNDEAITSRQIFQHEVWHARTDYPIPPDITAMQDRIYEELGKR